MAKMVSFSALSGKAVLHGAPVPGATVERAFRWSWQDEIGKDSTTSGAISLNADRKTLMTQVVAKQLNK